MQHLIREEVIQARHYLEYGKEQTPSTVAAQYGMPESAIVDLSLNVNPLGPPLSACRAVERSAAVLHRYPDAALARLRGCIGERHGVSPERVLVGAGIDDLLKLLAQTVVGPGTRAIIPIPTFPRYELEVRLMGGQPDLVRLGPGFALPADAILQRVDAATRLIFIASPNNPTGARAARAAILRLLELGECGPLVVVDEALLCPLEPGVMDLVPAHRNLLVLRTLSKHFGLAGARVGYAVGDAELIGFMDLVRPSYNVSVSAEAAALAALDDYDYLVRSRANLEAERHYLTVALDALPGLAVWPSQTTILLLDVAGTGHTSTAVTDALAARGVLVVDCRIFAGLEDQDYLRVSIGPHESNRRLVEALGQIVG